MSKRRPSHKTNQQRRRLARRKRVPLGRKEAGPHRFRSRQEIGPDELAVIDRVYTSVRAYEYEVRGVTEPEPLGLLMAGAIARQLWQTAGPQCNWSHLDPMRILDDFHELPEGMFNGLYVSLYAFATWLHHNEGVPGSFVSTLHAAMDSCVPKAVANIRAISALRYADPANRLTCPTAQAQRARHAEPLRRRQAN